MRNENVMLIYLLAGFPAVNDFLIYHCGEPVKYKGGRNMAWHKSIQKFPALVYLS